MTMILSTDDYCKRLTWKWLRVGPLDILKKNASRMRIVSVYDLSPTESLRALRHLRRHALARMAGSDAAEVQIESDEIMQKVYAMVGGRTSFLARAARAPDMIGEAYQSLDGH